MSSVTQSSADDNGQTAPSVASPPPNPTAASAAAAAAAANDKGLKMKIKRPNKSGRHEIVKQEAKNMEKKRVHSQINHSVKKTNVGGQTSSKDRKPNTSEYGTPAPSTPSKREHDPYDFCNDDNRPSTSSSSSVPVKKLKSDALKVGLNFMFFEKITSATQSFIRCFSNNSISMSIRTIR